VHLILLLALLFAADAVAQPAPGDSSGAPAPPRVGGTHLYVEAFGAAPQISVNLDQRLGAGFVARGGLGVSADGDGFVPLGGVGLSLLPVGGAFRPELGVSVTSDLPNGEDPLTAAYLGFRVYTRNRALLRVGVTGFLLPSGRPRPILPMPGVGFGWRL
jgi:hypothetical protein